MDQYELEMNSQRVSVSSDSTSYSRKISVVFKDGEETFEFYAGSPKSLVVYNVSNSVFSRVVELLGKSGRSGNSLVDEIVNFHKDFVENRENGNFKFLIDSLLPKSD